MSDAGGHYYSGSVSVDPWGSIAYTSDASGASSGNVSVDTGSVSVDLVGKAMIVHAFDGSRIGCALLSDGIDATLEASAFVPYYTYSGSLSVSGRVGPMVTTGTTQRFSWSLTGVDPACASGAGSAGNSCGLHIHSRSTCTGDAGGRRNSARCEVRGARCEWGMRRGRDADPSREQVVVNCQTKDC